MFSFIALFIVYVLGGLTFLPVVVAAFAGFVFYTSPVVKVDPAIRQVVESRAEDANTEDESNGQISGTLDGPANL